MEFLFQPREAGFFNVRQAEIQLIDRLAAPLAQFRADGLGGFKPMDIVAGVAAVTLNELAAQVHVLLFGKLHGGHRLLCRLHLRLHLFNLRG